MFRSGSHAHEERRLEQFLVFLKPNMKKKKKKCWGKEKKERVKEIRSWESSSQAHMCAFFECLIFFLSFLLLLLGSFFF